MSTNEPQTVGNNNESAGFLSNLGDKLSALVKDQKKNVAAITLVAAVSAGIIVVMLWATAASFKPLFSESDQYLTGDVISVLEAEGVPYEMEITSGIIYVPDGQVASTRMLLASKGVVPEKPLGLESLAENSPLGTSQFIENARYKRGLEGELAMTIMGLSAISNARVHLAIPEQTLFVRQTGDKASASVLVELKSGDSLDTNQVRAIMNIVSSSVPGMPLENVAVSDQFGTLLSSEVGSDITGAMDEKFIEYQRRVEKDLITRAKDVLLPILGVGNFKVQATADLNFDVRSEEAEQIAGDPALITEKLITSTGANRNAYGIPGSLSNQPPPPVAVEANDEQLPEVAQPAIEPRNSQEERAYAQGTRTIKTQYRQGDVERISVAVILNRAAAADPAVGWLPEEVTSIENTVATALGINLARGDSLVVETFNFTVEQLPPVPAVPWYEDSLNQLMIKLGVATLVSLGLIFLVLRPLVKNLSSPSYIDPVRIPEGADGAIASMTSGDGDEHGAEIEGFEQFGTKLPPTGSALDVQLEHLQLLAHEDAERVAEVLKEWVREDE